jgi:hypothetical protein
MQCKYNQAHISHLIIFLSSRLFTGYASKFKHAAMTHDPNGDWSICLHPCWNHFRFTLMQQSTMLLEPLYLFQATVLSVYWIFDWLLCLGRCLPQNIYYYLGCSFFVQTACALHWAIHEVKWNCCIITKCANHIIILLASNEVKKLLKCTHCWSEEVCLLPGGCYVIRGYWQDQMVINSEIQNTKRQEWIKRNIEWKDLQSSPGR